MRITSKGQVTIPVEIREKAGLLPNTEVEFELDGTIRTANDNFLQAVGYDLREIQGKHHRMFCDESYTNTLEYRNFWQKLARGEFDSGEYKRVGKGGKEIWINASYNPIFDASGKPFKVVKYATDVTAQVRRKQEFNVVVLGTAEALAKKIQLVSEQATQVAHGAQSLGATTEEMNASVEELSASIDSIAAWAARSRSSIACASPSRARARVASAASRLDRAWSSCRWYEDASSPSVASSRERSARVIWLVLWSTAVCAD